MREQTGLEVEAEEIIRTTEDAIEGEHYITLFVYCYLLTEQRLQVQDKECPTSAIVVTNQIEYD